MIKTSSIIHNQPAVGCFINFDKLLMSILKFGCLKNLNRMRVELVEAELLVKTNFRMTFAEFYNFVLGKKPLLKAVKSNLKFRFKSKS